jgi:hypothetical protein
MSDGHTRYCKLRIILPSISPINLGRSFLSRYEDIVNNTAFVYFYVVWLLQYVVWCMAMNGVMANVYLPSDIIYDECVIVIIQAPPDWPWTTWWLVGLALG